MKNSTVLIIGSGIAALQLARKLQGSLNVKILTKSNIHVSNSYKAQGGVAVALANCDNPYKHYLDTLEAGRNHNNSEAVLEMTKAAPSLIMELFNEGCSFDTDEKGKLLLGREGAHCEKRIVHGGGDATGKTIMDFLAERIYETTVIENVQVFELIMNEQRCVGVKGKHLDGRVESFYGDHIVLATGGLGQMYSFTTNAETVTGDGIALAYRAGAEIADMEFIQFHPTLLYVNQEGKGLVSEAVRGEGARLVTEDGKYIMEGVHPQKDLAPRHIVSQTIYDYIRQGNQVYLDISAIDHFKERFPTVSDLCEVNGIDLKKGMIPVVPGCHFLMGGVKTDLYGRTNIKGLYAIGEIACTGIHGANRLASNSLLEGLFFGKNLAKWLCSDLVQKRNDLTSSSIHSKSVFRDPSLALPVIPELKVRMMDLVGIVRTKDGLLKQKEWLENYGVEQWIEKDLEQLSREEMNRVFMLITSWLVTKAALQRTESRGGHFRSDYPEEDNRNWFKQQIIQKIHIAKDVENEQIKAAVTT